MQAKSGMMIIAITVSVLMLAGCQTSSVEPSKSNSIEQSVNNDVNLIIPLPDIPDSDGDGVLDDIDACPMTTINTVVDKNGCPIPIDLIGFLTMEIRVFYENSSSELQDNYLPEVEKLAEKMNKYPNQVVVLSGHISKREVADTSEDSKSAREQIPVGKSQLGRTRAQSIKLALIERGVPNYRIYTFDCADNIPVALNNTEEGATMNQRVYGQAMPAIDFLMGKGSRLAESYDYYKSSCEQF